MAEKSDLYDHIYAIVRKVPRGRVTTYGAVARALGLASGARVVGYAMNAAHNVKPRVPAHRVVNRLGILSGKHHFGSPTAMEEALRSEGVSVLEDAVQEFDRRFWDPASLGGEA